MEDDRGASQQSKIEYVNPAQCAAPLLNIMSHLHALRGSPPKPCSLTMWLGLCRYHRICQRRAERAMRESVRPTLPRQKVSATAAPHVNACR